MLKIKHEKTNNELEKVNIIDNRFNDVYISFSVDAPYYALKNNIEFTSDSNGYVLIDTGYRIGNNDKRFISFHINDGIVNRKEFKVEELSKNDEIRVEANNVLSNFIPALEFSGFNNTQIELLAAGVSI